METPLAVEAREAPQMRGALRPFGVANSVGLCQVAAASSCPGRGPPGEAPTPSAGSAVSLRWGEAAGPCRGAPGLAPAWGLPSLVTACSSARSEASSLLLLESLPPPAKSAPGFGKLRPGAKSPVPHPTPFWSVGN